MEERREGGGGEVASSLSTPFVESLTGSSKNLNSSIAAKTLATLVDSTAILSVDGDGDGEEGGLQAPPRHHHVERASTTSTSGAGKQKQSNVVKSSIEIVASPSSMGAGGAPMRVVSTPAEDQLLEEIPSQVS